MLAMALLSAVLCGGCERAPAPPAPAAPASDADRPQRLPTATIRVGGAPLVVEVARDPAEQAKGMMFRRSLGPDEAMLFIFDRETNHSFWMKNTYVDLDLAFIGGDGAIVQTERMRAFATEPVFSREPARFALEVPAGWFAAHGVGEGTKVLIPPEVAGGAPAR